MAFKMKGWSPFHQEKTTKEKTTEEKIAEIQVTRDNLNKKKNTVYNPNKPVKEKAKINTLVKPSVTGGVIPGLAGDFTSRLKKLITLDYGQEAVNKTD